MNRSTRLLACAVLAVFTSGCTSQTQEDARNLADQIEAAQNSIARGAGSNSGDQNTRAVLEQIALARSSMAQQKSSEQAYAASDMLTDDEISEITGAKVREKKTGDTFHVYENFCTWYLISDAGLNQTIELSVVSPGGRNYYDRGLALATEKPLSGLGDVAILHKSGNTAAVKGDSLVEIRFGGPSTNREEVTRRLVEKVFSRLP